MTFIFLCIMAAEMNILICVWVALCTISDMQTASPMWNHLLSSQIIGAGTVRWIPAITAPEGSKQREKKSTGKHLPWRKSTGFLPLWCSRQPRAPEFGFTQKLLPSRSTPSPCSLTTGCLLRKPALTACVITEKQQPQSDIFYLKTGAG